MTVRDFDMIFKVKQVRAGGCQRANLENESDNRLKFPFQRTRVFFQQKFLLETNPTKTDAKIDVVNESGKFFRLIKNRKIREPSMS